MTNDGEAAHRLAHPSFGVPKLYRAVVTGPVPKDLGRRLRAGVELEDGMVAVDDFRVVDQVGKEAQIELTIHVGRNRVVRRLMAEVGLPVRRSGSASVRADPTGPAAPRRGPSALAA